MTNNYENDENHEHGEFVEHELTDAEKPQGVTGNLAEAWRTKPFFKFMVLLIAVFAVGVAGFSFLGKSTTADLSAHLARPPGLKEAPGGIISPYMKQQTELANKERSDEAIASGGSAIPTPIGQPSDEGSFDKANPKDDPLNELRLETQQLRQQNQQTQAQLTQVQQQQSQKPPEPFDDSLAQAMQAQMKQLMEGWTPHGIKEVTVVKPEDLKAQEAKAAGDNAAANGGTPTPPPVALVNAGTVSYAQLLTEANSDVPGPILAQIVSGPLAGARAIGGFQVSEGYEKYLVLRFSIADRKGTDYQINAIALDPNTTLGGMATEVDERYFVRVVLPAAAGFLQGMGSALGQGNSSITTNGTTTISTTTGNGFRQGVYTGMGQAANTAGQFFQDQANLTKPLVRVASGTAMGFFFITPVYDPNTLPAQSPYLTNQQANYPQGAYGQNAYPGQNVLGYGGGLPNSGIQQNIAAGLPYPNYGAPQGSYQGIGGGPGQMQGYTTPVVQQNLASGVPYPNYAVPGSGYNNIGSSVTHFNGYPGQ